MGKSQYKRESILKKHPKWVNELSVAAGSPLLLCTCSLTYPDGVKENLFSEAIKHQVDVWKVIIDPTRWS